MAKSEVRLDYDGETYTLCYTRETVRQMESSGFNIQDYVNGTRPGTQNYMLFEGAFRAKHAKIKRKRVSEIYDHIDDKSGLNLVLAEMYGETLSSMLDGAEDDGKKATWETV